MGGYACVYISTLTAPSLIISPSDGEKGGAMAIEEPFGRVLSGWGKTRGSSPRVR